jgi:transposase
VTRWRHGSDPTVVKNITTTVEAMMATYRKQVPADSLTVLEASTNAFDIARRLAAAGFGVKVLASDTLAGRARADRVNDRIDAGNLAVAYARGGTREVLVPGGLFAEWRDVWFGYDNAVRDSVRWSNRIWSFCSGHGFKLPKAQFARKEAEVRAQVSAFGWTESQSFAIDMMLGEYAHACEVRKAYQSRIERTVAGNADMTRVMQVLGVRFIVAFVMVTFIEDVRRFPNARKLVSYVGLNPNVCSTGNDPGSRAVSRYGRRDLKALMVEAAQCAMRRGNAGMHKWARRKCAEKKHPNIVVCALARKMVCHIWHVLMGHQTPNTEPEASFKRKLAKLATSLGKKEMAELGYQTPREYIAAVCDLLYPRKPPAEPQNGTLASA